MPQLDTADMHPGTGSGHTNPKNTNLISIGLLICDQVAPELHDQHRGYDHMLTQLLAFSLEYRDQKQISISSYNLTQGQFPKTPDQHQVYITSGSKCSVNDDIDWIHDFATFTVECCKQQIPYIGICFGHQMLAKALGGTVEETAKGWGIGSTYYQFKTPNPLWANVPEPPSKNMNLCISHKEQVLSLPKGSKVIAGNAFCPNGVVLYTPTALGIQGHPEFSIEYCRDLMNLRQNLYPKATFEAGLQSLYQGVDQQLWSRWLLDYLNIQGLPLLDLPLLDRDQH
jgi:GMP synthase-like glutamine amidotransferase